MHDQFHSQKQNIKEEKKLATKEKTDGKQIQYLRIQILVRCLKLKRRRYH